MEWNAGQRKRVLQVLHTVDSRYPPDPELDQSYLDTVTALDCAGAPPYARTALRYFRYGLLDDQPDDQFMRIWSSLEIIAENSKDTTRVPMSCPSCKSDMTCSVCGTTPTRAPTAKQAIEQLIERIIGDKSMAEVVSKRQFIARNGSCTDERLNR
jgi:hypothetical protein